MIRPSLSLILAFAFSINTWGPLPVSQAQASPAIGGNFYLPVAGQMVALSPPFDPPVLKAIKVYSKNPFRFDFILDQGDVETPLMASLRDESIKLIKYFLASLTIPEKDLWVNLSPYEKDRIIPQSFGFTEMGRDLLAEDYMLKQITASLIYPEGTVGKRFWKRIYEEAGKKFGNTNMAVHTFNKVWIIPEKAVVYENTKAGTAYVVESKLKVMLEQDYLALEKHTLSFPNALIGNPDISKAGPRASASVRHEDPIKTFGGDKMASQVLREVMLPELQKEVNEGKNFAQLRQVYNSLILATWYKKKIKDSILAQVYADKNKIAGVKYDNSLNDLENIYHRYLQAFKKGVYNYIQEETDPLTKEAISRKYFSGGATFLRLDAAMIETPSLGVIPLTMKKAQRVTVDLAMALGAEDGPVLKRFFRKLEHGESLTITYEGPIVVHFPGGYSITIVKAPNTPVGYYFQDAFDVRSDGRLIRGQGTFWPFYEDKQHVFGRSSPETLFGDKLKGLSGVSNRHITISRKGDVITFKDGALVKGVDDRLRWQESKNGTGIYYLKAISGESARPIEEVSRPLEAESTSVETALIPQRTDSIHRDKKLGGRQQRADLKVHLTAIDSRPLETEMTAYFIGHVTISADIYLFDVWVEGKNVRFMPYGSEQEPQVVDFNQEFTVGRNEGNYPLPRADGLSRKHFSFKVWSPDEQGRAMIHVKDWESRNGTEVQWDEPIIERNANPAQITAPVKAPRYTADQKAFTRGGIDLTTANMNLQTKVGSRASASVHHEDPPETFGDDRWKSGIKFHLDPAMFVKLKDASGFFPLIVKIQSLTDIRSFLTAPE